MLAAEAIQHGYRLIHRAEVGSTNGEALALAASGDPGRLWYVADAQTAGRGRVGRQWSSPPGNLYASLLLVDACEPRLAAQLGFVAGVALVEAIDEVAGAKAPVALKWPNDLLVDGAKLAGILVEGVPSADRFAAVIGFGVNCASHPATLSYPTTHLMACVGEGATRDAVMTALSRHMDRALSRWQRGLGFAAIRDAWLERALPQGSPLAVVRGEDRLTGRFYSIDRDGRLILETDRGLMTVEAGDVFLASREMTAAS